jgi:hypothetical protein
MRILDERREALVERERSASQSTRKHSAFAVSAQLFLASLRALASTVAFGPRCLDDFPGGGSCT